MENKLLAGFLFSILMIEVNLGFSGINLGNIFVSLGSLLVIIVICEKSRPGYMLGMLLSLDFCFVILIAFYFILSIFWSVSPLDTLAQSIYFVLLIVACYALRSTPVYLLVRFIILSSVVVGLLSLFALLISPNFAFQPVSSTAIPELRGIFKHQQRLGLFMYLSAGLIALAIFNREPHVFEGSIMKHKWKILFFVTFVGVLAFARLNMLFAFLAFTLCLFSSRYGFLKRITILLLVTIVLLFIFSHWPETIYYNYKSGDISLSGRFIIWERTLEYSMDRATLGYGFGTFNAPILDYFWGDYRPPHAHNSFVQAYFDGGVVGFILFVILAFIHFFVSTKITTNTKFSYSSFVFYLTFLCSFTGVIYAGKPSVLYAFLFLFIAVESRTATRYLKFN